jgi:hypothetical protein
MSLTSLTIADLQSKLRAREFSPTEALTALEARIAQIDPQIHGYLSRDFAAASAQAAKADVTLPLGGVPIAIKDVINVIGEPCTCGSKIMEGYRSNYDATVIRKLRAAGAIPFGRCNLDEFAKSMGHGPGAGRLQRRIGGGGRRGRSLRSARFGYWRLDSPTRRALRLRGIETHIRTRIPVRARGVCLFAGPDRAVHENRPRFRPAPERDFRTRSPGFHEHR